MKENLIKYIVGAYATSPNLLSWNEESETTYFNLLKQLTQIRGLELPFWGDSIHPHDNEWLLQNMDPNWQNVITCIPGTMKFLEYDEYFGLASQDKNSRLDAINFYFRVLECVKILNNRFGENNVLAVQVASSPKNTNQKNNGTKDIFYESLSEIVSWDWLGARIVIEHCDSITEFNPIPKKGFLSLEDEIDTINKINSAHNYQCGMTINWGRSVIEDKNVLGPIRHIKESIKHNALSGLMLSGTTDSNNNLYGEWSDLHMPPANYLNFQHFESESLMSFDNIKNTIAACDYNKLDYLGIKLMPLPDSFNNGEKDRY